MRTQVRRSCLVSGGRCPAGCSTLATLPNVSNEHGGARADAVRNRERILAAALDVLATEPAASMSTISARAGLTRATVYRHFPSRDLLWSALQDEALRRAGAVLTRTSSRPGSPRDAIRATVRDLLGEAQRFGILLGGAEADPRFGQRRAAALRPLRDLLLRARDGGELRSGTDPDWAFAALTALLTAAVRAGPVGRPPEETADLICGTFFDGLGHPNARFPTGDPTGDPTA